MIATAYFQSIIDEVVFMVFISNRTLQPWQFLEALTGKYFHADHRSKSGKGGAGQ